MAKLTTTRIERFDESMTDDLRDGRGVQSLRHFDVKRGSLTPYRSYQTTQIGGGTLAQAEISTLELVNGTVYGLGKNFANSALPEIYDMGQSGVNYQFTAHATFGATGAAASVLGAYKNNFYGLWKGTNVWRGELDGTPVPVDYQSLTYTNASVRPVHHQGDDSLYFFTDNNISRLNDATWDGTVLTLPFDIIAADEFDNFLAVASKDTNTGKNYVYFWDRDSSLVTVSAKIDLGRGTLCSLRNINGTLIAVKEEGNPGISLADDCPELVVYAVTPTGAVEMNRVSFPERTSGDKIVCGSAEYVNDNALYLSATLTDAGTNEMCILKVMSDGTVFIDQRFSNVTVGSIGSFVKFGNTYVVTDVTNNTVINTATTAIYNESSLYESRVFGDAFTPLNFKGATVSFEKLPTAGIVTLKYKEPEDTTWTTMGTQSDDNAKRLIVTQNTAGLPYTMTEVQFRIESTGGAVLTAFEFVTEDSDDKPY